MSVTTAQSALHLVQNFNFHTLFLRAVSTTVALALTFSPAMVHALPQGGSVVAGTADIVNTSTTRMDINQSSDKAILNWDSFGNAANEHINFNQPSASSAALNRVVGTDPSQILGNLTANGQVMIVNPNGVFFGHDATVDVAGLVATTADISNENFMAGNYAFDIASDNPNAQVVNNGTINITAAASGIAAFVSPFAANNGVINAKLGKVSLAGTDTFTLDLYGDDLVKFALEDEVGEHVVVSQNGTIDAEGGTVAITAGAARELVDSVINLDGVTLAQSVSNEGGVIKIRGAGNITASADNVMDVSGIDGADAGELTLIAGETMDFKGVAKAEGSATGGDGGFIEVSGKELLIDGDVFIGAAQGNGGEVLFDPVNLTITAQTATRIENAMANAGNGTINVAAENRISVEADIDTTGQGNTATLNFQDQDANNALTVWLYNPITLDTGQTLTGEATRVQVRNTNALLSNAVDLAANNARIDIFAGTYTIPEQIVIGKNLDIRGDTRDNTILNIGFNTGSSGDSRGWFVVNGSGSLNMRDITMDGTGYNVWQAIRDYGTGSDYRNMAFKNIGFDPSGPSYAGTAIAAFGTGATDVRNTTFENIGRIGVQYFGAGASGGLYTGNTYTGKGVGDWLDYGVEIGGGAGDIRIQNSNFSNIYGVTATPTPYSSAGVLATTYYGLGTTGTLTGNTFENSSNGVVIGFGTTDGTNLVATGNTFNTVGTGFTASSGAGLDARNNTMTGVTNGFDVANVGNLRIQNNNMTGDGTGLAINVDNSPNATVNQNTINTFDEAVILSSSAGSTVNGNIISNLNDDGIDIQNSANTQVNNNQLTTVSQFGIRVNASNGATVNNNTLVGVSRNGIILSNSQNATVSSNNIDGSNRTGIKADSGNNAGSEIFGNTLTGTYRDYGIDARNIAEVRNNTVNGAGIAGIMAESIDRVNGNTVTNSTDGVILLGDNSGHQFNNNTLENNTVGLRIQGTATGLTTSGNTYTGNIKQHVINETADDFNMINSTFDGTQSNNMTLAQLFAAEDMITHKMDDNAVGFITIGANNSAYVTTNNLGIAQGVANVTTNGDVFINDGIYTLNGALLLDTQGLTLSGLSRNGVMIDASGNSSSRGIIVEGNGTTLENFTLQGPIGGDDRFEFGIKIQPDTLVATDTINNVTVQNVTVQGSGRSEIDINGGRNITIDNVLVDGQNTGGVGIAVTDSRNLNFSNITTQNNNWGGIGLFAAGRFYTGGTRDVDLTGTNTFGESNPLYIQESNGFEVRDVWLPDFSHVVNNNTLTEFTWLQQSEQQAVDFALVTPAGNTQAVVRTILHDNVGMVSSPENNFIVAFNTGATDNLNIQTAVDFGDAGMTINVRDGVFNLPTTLTLNQALTLVGNGEGNTILDASGYGGWGVHVPASDVTLRDFTIADANHYGLKVDRGSNANNTNFLAENITVQGSARTEVDLNGVTDATIRNVTANGQGTSGNGFAITSGQNVIFDGVMTDGQNTWGGLAVYSGGFYGEDTDRVQVLNAAGIQEVNPVYAQNKPGFNITNLYVPEFDFGVRNDTFRVEAPQFTFYQRTEADAGNFATGYSDFVGFESDSTIQTVTHENAVPRSTLDDDNFIVVENMSIQKALDNVVANGNVNVRTGTFTEDIKLSQAVNLLGAGAGNTNLLNSLAIVDGDDVTIDGFTFTNGKTLGGEMVAMFVNGANNTTIQNNTFTGPGNAANNSLGILAENTDGLNLDTNQFNAWNYGAALVDALNAVVNNNTFDSNFIGLGFEGLDAVVTNNTFTSSGLVALEIADSSLITNPNITLTDNTFAASNNRFIDLTEDVTIDAGQNTFNGILPINMTLTELEAVELKINHGPDGTPFDGLVQLVPNDVLLSLLAQDAQRLLSLIDLANALGVLGGNLSIFDLIQPAAGEDATAALGFAILAIVQYFINTGFIVDEEEAIRALMLAMADGTIDPTLLETAVQ